MRRVIIAAVVVLHIASIVACCCVPLSEQVAATKKANANRPPSKVTRENYLRITHLMSIGEVNDILGPGKEVSRTRDHFLMVWSGDVSITITFETNGGDGRNDSWVREKTIGGG